MKSTRRGFLKGLGTVIGAAALPRAKASEAIPEEKSAEKPDSRFTLGNAWEPIRKGDVVAECRRNTTVSSCWAFDDFGDVTVRDVWPPWVRPVKNMNDWIKGIATHDAAKGEQVKIQIEGEYK